MVVREHIVEPVVELAVDMVHLNGRDDHHGLQLSAQRRGRVVIVDRARKKGRPRTEFLMQCDPWSLIVCRMRVSLARAQEEACWVAHWHASTVLVRVEGR